MVVSAIVGFKRDGKTVFDVKLIYDAVKAGKKILTNFNVAVPHKKLKMSEIMDDISLLKNTSMNIDEAYLYIDSRKFSNKGNILFSYLNMQSGHVGLDINMTAPQYSLLDIRQRANVDYIYHCTSMRLADGVLRRCTIEETEAMLVDRIMIKMVIVRENRLVKFLFDPRFYFDKYDTHEFVDITT